MRLDRIPRREFSVLRKIGAVFEAFVLEPEDVEVEFAPIATASSKQQERRVQAVDGANNPRSTRLL